MGLIPQFRERRRVPVDEAPRREAEDDGCAAQPSDAASRAALGVVDGLDRLLVTSETALVCAGTLAVSPLLLILPEKNAAGRYVRECVWDRTGRTAARWGPTAIKFLQWSATRRDLFSDAYCRQASNFQTRVKPDPFPLVIIPAMQAASKAKKPRLLIRPVPFGCGSVAQVHSLLLPASGNTLVEEEKKQRFEKLRELTRVKLNWRKMLFPLLDKNQRRDAISEWLHTPVKDRLQESFCPLYEEAVVKILRPFARRRVLHDTNTLRRGARVASSILGGNKYFPVSEAAEQFAEMIRPQTDLLIEAESLRKFNANFTNRKARKMMRGLDGRVKVPHVYNDFSSQEILVESREAGIPFDQWLRKLQAERIDQFLQTHQDQLGIHSAAGAGALTIEDRNQLRHGGVGDENLTKGAPASLCCSPPNQQRRQRSRSEVDGSEASPVLPRGNSPQEGRPTTGREEVGSEESTGVGTDGSTAAGTSLRSRLGTGATARLQEAAARLQRASEGARSRLPSATVKSQQLARSLWQLRQSLLLKLEGELDPDLAQEEAGVGVDEHHPKIAAAPYVARVGAHMFLKMLLIDNFVHADLHPGNLLVHIRHHDHSGPKTSFLGRALPFGRAPPPNPLIDITVLDAGLTTTLTPKDRVNFVDLFRAIAFGDGYQAGRLLIERAKSHECENEEEFCEGVSKVVSHFVSPAQRIHSAVRERPRHGRWWRTNGFAAAVEENLTANPFHRITAREFKVGAALQDILALSIRHKVELDTCFVGIALAISILEGVAQTLDPDIDLLAAARPFFSVIAADQLRKNQTKFHDTLARLLRRDKPV